MTTNVYDLVNLLRDVRSRYQAEFIDAMETEKKEFAILDRDYKVGSPTYTAKKQEIQLACDMTIVKARKKAAKKAAEEIESMKEWERTGVGTINTEALARVNALRGIPVTTEELKQILSKHGSSNYWVQRAVAALAEENGIPVTDLPLDSSLDVKLNVLDQLCHQLDLLLEHFSLTAKTREASEARFLYLNDSVLDNAIKIYTNGTEDLSEADAAERAYYKIRAMSGQMSKAVAISNSMRNLKKEDTRNMLLYRLATDDTIMAEAYQVAGISDVIAEWKGGKADRYAKAIKMMDNIKIMQDTEDIKANLKSYINRVEMGSEPANEFLRHEITKAYKKNTFIGRALEEMNYTDRKMLLGDSQIKKEQVQDKKTADDHYARIYKEALDRKSGSHT